MTDKAKNTGFAALIEALTILAKYDNGETEYPTHCEHDVLYVQLSEPVTDTSDRARLEELGFVPGVDSGREVWMSYRFGSA